MKNFIMKKKGNGFRFAILSIFFSFTAAITLVFLTEFSFAYEISSTTPPTDAQLNEIKTGTQKDTADFVSNADTQGAAELKAIGDAAAKEYSLRQKEMFNQIEALRGIVPNETIDALERKYGVGLSASNNLSVTAAAPAGSILFLRNLKQGDSGADVLALQKILNRNTDTQITSTGPGSPGNETSYFGALTKAAVIKFQEKYVAEILAPFELASGTGFVGVATRAVLNTL